VDQRPGVADVEGLPQPAHVHVDHVGLRVEVQVPDAFEQHGARHDLARMPHQVLEQAELASREVHGPAAAGHLAPDEVHLQVRHLEAGRGLGRCGTPRQHLDACEQLGEGERLREVVVTAGAQALDAIVHFRERAQDQDRRGDALRAQGLHHREAVHVGQHAVGDDHVVARGQRQREPFGAVRRVVDAVAAFPQPGRDVIGRAPVVLDEQQFHRRKS